MDATAFLRDLDDRMAELQAVRVAIVAAFGAGPTSSTARRATRRGRRGAPGTEATGTKAVILDVLTTASEPMSLKDIATGAKITAPNAGFHIRPLVRDGDVVQLGAGKTTRYAIG